MIEIYKDDSPLEVAYKLINSTYAEQAGEHTIYPKMFSTGQLRQIGRHLLVYTDGQEEEERNG